MSQVIAPEWLTELQNQSRDKVVSVTDAYARVPLVFRAARFCADSLARIPIHIYQDGKEVEMWDERDQDGHVINPSEWVWLTEMHLRLAGGSPWLHLKNRTGFSKGSQLLNPFSIQVLYYNRERRFYQVLNGYMIPADKPPPQDLFYWTDKDIYFWREYHPTDDVRFGISSASAALQNSQVLYYLTRFASVFFETGAMPAALVPLPPGTDSDTEKKINDWFKKAMTGVRNAWRVLALRVGQNGLMQPVLFEPNLKKFETPALNEAAAYAVADAFEIPVSVLLSHRAQQGNRATSQTDFRSYMTQKVIPRTNTFQFRFNSFLEEKRSPYRIKFAPNEVTELQEDELPRAQSYSFYVGAGMPDDIAAEIIGLDIPLKMEQRWREFNAAKQKQDTTAVPTDTTTRAASDSTTATGNENNSGETDATTGNENKSLCAVDLEKWERKVLKRVERRAAAACKFESEYIPTEWVPRIEAELAVAGNAEQVKAIFRTWLTRAGEL